MHIRGSAGAAALGAPKAAGARMDGRADYEKRALLYLTDRNDYLEHQLLHHAHGWSCDGRFHKNQDAL